jgi:DNA invertase Pin-like site-specific DNA recombinase
LRTYARAQGWETRDFVDYETGKHARRAAMQQVFSAASRREIGMVVVWALDRFTREGVSETFAHLKRLMDFGCGFESYTEPQFRTAGPFGEVMIALAATIAKMERARISDRTKAALERLRGEGKKLGRPGKVFRIDQARELRQDGASWRTIEKLLKVPQASIRRALEKASKNGPKKGVSKTPSRAAAKGH